MKIELALNAMVPAAERGALSLRLILHGRRVCIARTPSAATICVLDDICPVVAPAPQTLESDARDATCAHWQEEYDEQHQPGSRHLV